MRPQVTPDRFFLIEQRPIPGTGLLIKLSWRPLFENAPSLDNQNAVEIERRSNIVRDVENPGAGKVLPCAGQEGQAPVTIETACRLIQNRQPNAGASQRPAHAHEL